MWLDVTGLRCPPPAVVAVEAAARDDGSTAELFLREGMVRPDELVEALAQIRAALALGEPEIC